MLSGTTQGLCDGAMLKWCSQVVQLLLELPHWGDLGQKSPEIPQCSLFHITAFWFQKLCMLTPPEVRKGDFYNSINVLPEKTLPHISGDFVLVFFIFLLLLWHSPLLSYYNTHFCTRQELLKSFALSPCTVLSQSAPDGHHGYQNRDFLLCAVCSHYLCQPFSRVSTHWILPLSVFTSFRNF